MHKFRSGNGSCKQQNADDDDEHHEDAADNGDDEVQEQKQKQGKNDKKERARQRNFILRARQSISHAKLPANWLLDAPPEPGTIIVVKQAAEAWAKLAEYLKGIAKAEANGSITE